MYIFHLILKLFCDFLHGLIHVKTIYINDTYDVVTAYIF